MSFFGFLYRRYRQRQLARANQWLEMCQDANENHPGMYDDLVREAELAVAKLKEANPPRK